MKGKELYIGLRTALGWDGDTLTAGQIVLRALINLKTAKALGLTIPQSLLQRADEVIQ